MSKIYAVTAADNNFKDMLLKCYESTLPFVEQCFVHDLGGLNFGEKFSEARVQDIQIKRMYNQKELERIGFDKIPKIPYKPELIKKSISQIDNNDYLIWLDADTLVVSDLSGIRKNYDLGVTIRIPKTKPSDRPINAGVVILRKTEKALRFLDTWIEKCVNARSDQQELNRLIKVTHKNRNNTQSILGVQVYGFTCEEYNNFYFNSNKRTQDQAKILHYKNSVRKFHPTRYKDNV